MRTSGKLLLLCLAVGLLLESQNADAGDATRDVGSDRTSVELSKMLKRWQAEKGQRKASARDEEGGFYIFDPNRRSFY
nr:conotoxin precursor H [Conus ebraeus]